MRTFECYDCKHTWVVPHGEGGMGVDLVCPKCGSKNTHRVAGERGRGQGRGRRGGGGQPQGDSTTENT
ncbi:MAG: hypothetical protein Kow00106_13070 [Anaerolineae bacterium]